VADGKKTKNKKTNKKTTAKHIRIRLIGDCVNNQVHFDQLLDA